MIKINDHYFIAWLKTIKEYNFEKRSSGIYVDMTKEQYTLALKEYKETYKPILKEIRKVVKELATFTSNNK